MRRNVMREYMAHLGTVLMLIAFANMLIPDGNIKKYASLAMGFMLICAALTNFPSAIGNFQVAGEDFRISDDDIEAAQVQYRTRVIESHRENIKNEIEKRMKHGSKAFVEVGNQGEIISVTLRVRGDESEALVYITEELGLKRERIKIKYDKN